MDKSYSDKKEVACSVHIKANDALTEKQELLLEAMRDGEKPRSWFARMFNSGESLLRDNAAAKSYCDHMEFVATGIKRESELPKVDLWNKVARRLDEEERLSVLLGERRAEQKSVFTLHGFGGKSWGYAGAFVTAAFGFLVFSYGGFFPASKTPELATTAGNSSPLNSSAMIPSGVSPVSLKPQTGTRIRSIPEALEVDWMRSRGRVKMIQDPNQRSPIIWVRRNGSNQTARMVNQPSRLSQRVPIPVLPRYAADDLMNDVGSNFSGSSIQMLEADGPNAMTIANVK